MALLINEACTLCDACVPVCPNQAIKAGDPVYVIDALRCPNAAFFARVGGRQAEEPAPAVLVDLYQACPPPGSGLNLDPENSRTMAA